MTNERITALKNELRKIVPVIDALMLVWPSDQLTMISVLIQNLVFSSFTNADDEYRKMINILNALNELAKYDKNHHMVNWISSELSMAFDGTMMILDLDEYNIYDSDERDL